MSAIENFDAHTPMMQQYLEIKNQHKDEILFYRIGDFYEMFFDDAVTASRELDLTLTGKQCGLAERAPMCGVPFHSYEGYVARLIAKGYTFASETDTEVLVKLIDSCYQGEPLQALQAALAKVRGSYALAVLFKDYPDTIFAVKRESPLIVGWGEGENFVASDIPALLKYTRSYSVLEEGDMAVKSEAKRS